MSEGWSVFDDLFANQRAEQILNDRRDISIVELHLGQYFYPSKRICYQHVYLDVD